MTQPFGSPDSPAQPNSTLWSSKSKGLAAAEQAELVDHEEVGKLIDSRYAG